MTKKSAHDLSEGTDREAEWNEFLSKIVKRWSNNSDERKQHRSKLRESEILEAALRVFAREGISKSRMGDIADEAGIPNSAIYDYFSSKEDIAYKVPISKLAAFYASYSERVQGVESFYEKLYLYLWLSVDFSRKNPLWARVLYLEVWPSVALVEDPDLRKCIDDFSRIILFLIREGEAAGEWPHVENPYEISAILVGSINQMIITRALYLKPRNITKASESMLKRLLPLLNPYANHNSNALIP